MDELKKIVSSLSSKDQGLLVKHLLDRPMDTSEVLQLERLTGYLRSKLGVKD